MTMSEHTRRDFLKTVAAAGAVSLIAPRGLDAATQRRSIGANDRIRIGIIGCGDRGVGTEMASVHQHAQAENLEVIAVYDPWRVARETAAGKAKEWFGTDAKQCRTVDELLDLREVDAVFISSPDHWHAAHLEAAVKAGKHVYVEKPMANEIGELNRAHKAAKASGVIIQAGTQLRSTPIAMGCRELLKSGKLGKISRIDQVRNSDKPYWYQYLKPDVKAADLDWKTFTKGRTKKAFDPILYSGWYGYWEFSQGPVPQWGVHFLDLVHFIADLGIPETCVCLGGVYTWKDEHRFTAPDQVHALWHYPDGLMISYSTNFGNSAGNVTRFGGDKGMLRLDWSNATYSADGGINRDGSIRGENKVEPIEQTDHWVNWYRCMRDGKTPNASLDAGYQHAVASIMATMSYETGRRARFDKVKRTITLD
jgi:predicted dehydrogenase